MAPVAVTHETTKNAHCGATRSTKNKGTVSLVDFPRSCDGHDKTHTKCEQVSDGCGSRRSQITITLKRRQR